MTVHLAQRTKRSRHTGIGPFLVLPIDIVTNPPIDYMKLDIFGVIIKRLRFGCTSVEPVLKFLFLLPLKQSAGALCPTESTFVTFRGFVINYFMWSNIISLSFMFWLHTEPVCLRSILPSDAYENLHRFSVSVCMRP